MSEKTVKLLTNILPPEKLEEVDHWIAKYPVEQRQSAVMAALRIVQEVYGNLTTEYMNAVAEYLNMPPIAVYEVATFYTMYELKPAGRNLVNVCTNISCKLRDSAEIVHHLEKTLGVKLGETTDDGRFTLRSVECLGACVNAPMMQINKDYHENLTPEKVDAILEQYR
ncbi:NADH dehydrogenase I chain E (plasmid) [Legionella adelaidensis]|uniref:NADH-quinone oxidoreductase subunit E n=1 Tax=Legionella adelaidensis TaxID=45056 RepID=A0A0W0R0J3_9GAMM|nr:NADH-quinone oxidoreductase subunit NuoE [Legionella adelaidensis]KTC64565.1 NADH dehydrogenase I subunit E [Legionella adelaidensis]VEH85933.1 NADH dehydrogenase I chain E [Legionella adelaidensis]